MKPRQRGFIMVETVFAIAIVATAVATAAGAMSVSARVIDRASSRTTASWIAVSQAELVLDAAYVTTGGQYESVTTPARFTVSNTTLAFPDGDAAIQYVDITVQRNGSTVLTHRIVKVNR
ncbi:MAG: hypothetical protein HYY34_00600 [Chloroflexi bacterium]|nr:hypothetical protein [Chloroflexota bacterium]